MKSRGFLVVMLHHPGFVPVNGADNEGLDLIFYVCFISSWFTLSNTKLGNEYMTVNDRHLPDSLGTKYISHLKRNDLYVYITMYVSRSTMVSPGEGGHLA